MYFRTTLLWASADDLGSSLSRPAKFEDAGSTLYDHAEDHQRKGDDKNQEQHAPEFRRPWPPELRLPGDDRAPDCLVQAILR
jgi:hypothetical protein